MTKIACNIYSSLWYFFSYVEAPVSFSRTQLKYLPILIDERKNWNADQFIFMSCHPFNSLFLILVKVFGCNCSHLSGLNANRNAENGPRGNRTRIRPTIWLWAIINFVPKCYNNSIKLAWQKYKFNAWYNEIWIIPIYFYTWFSFIALHKWSAKHRCEYCQLTRLQSSFRANW